MASIVPTALWAWTLDFVLNLTGKAHPNTMLRHQILDPKERTCVLLLP